MKQVQMMTAAILASLSLVVTACTDREAEVEKTDSAVTAPANTGAIEGNEAPSLSGSATGVEAEEEETNVNNKSAVEAED